MIKGFGFSGYRSVGKELVKITPLKKVNLIIGQNNVGKSNIINFLVHHYSNLISRSPVSGTRPSKVSLSEVDRHISTSNSQAICRIAFPVLKNELEQFIADLITHQNSNQNFMYIKEILQRLLASRHFSDEDNTVWVAFREESQNLKLELDIDKGSLIGFLTPMEWNGLYNAMSGGAGGGFT